MKPIKMTAREQRAALSLSVIFALRMLGLFMILPVFALYAEHLSGVTPLLIGMAIGVYGLTQALFQIPFGMLSDRFGRKPVIALGLLIFAAGSAVAALSTSIEGVILGRALQGMGAIAAAVMALAADLTSEEHRTKAMGIIGMSIGMSFIAAMVAGPILNEWISVPGIFWLIAILALLGIGVLYLGVPDPGQPHFHLDAEAEPAQFKTVLRDGQLLRLDFGILVLHMVLTATFVVVPLKLRDMGLLGADHWQLYLPVMVLAMLAMVPFIIIAEKRHQLKNVFLGAIALLLIAELLLMQPAQSLLFVGLVLWLFFTAFNLLEASLPSLVSKTAPADAKGTAMGIYSSAQFFGAFLGGVLGGWAYGQWGMDGAFALCAGLIALWWLAATSMRSPRYLSTYMVNVGSIEAGSVSLLEEQIRRVAGVVEAVVHPEDGVAYLKVDTQLLDIDELTAFSINKV